jgi:osmotically-inducible protein OsmY
MATTTAVRTDEQIQQDILAEMKWDARVGPNEIGVIVKDGVVTLTGWVDSFTKKWAAEEAAQRVIGVKALADDIEVRLPSSAVRTDADIAAAASRALEWDVVVPIERIEITVSKGMVTLFGEVDWSFQKEDAERVVSRLTGVRAVINQLTVRPLPHPSASQLKQEIERALVRSAEVDANRIQVELRDSGKVVLKGTVRSWAERQEAERVARRRAGVTAVDNQIMIKPE